MQAPPNWFHTNAPAGWISAAIASAGFIYMLVTRKKPRRLNLHQARNTSVVSIAERVREKIKISFEEKAVKSLGQIEATIFNSGSEPIHDPSFTLALSDESTILSEAVVPYVSGNAAKDLRFNGTAVITKNKLRCEWGYPLKRIGLMGRAL
jgi:hypothetical protein